MGQRTTSQGDTLRRRAIRALHREDLTPREIAGLLHLSPQAIYQHLKAIREQDQRTDAA
ncbi:MAG: ArsR family transcriptional regulator [Actinomycetota bacterium]